MADSIQVWVRNDKGQVYGPLTPPSVELLIDNGIIAGRLQVSTNGSDFVFPGRVPGLRMIFPKETWGETVVPGEALDAEWSKVAMPYGMDTGQGPGGAAPGPPVMAPGGPPGGPVAGPGARGPAPGPGVPRGPVGGPVAGPGARAVGARMPPPGSPAAKAAAAGRQQSVAEFMTGAVAGAINSTPSGIAQAPPIKSGPSVLDFMNAATGGAPVSSTPSGVAAAPAAPAARVAPQPNRAPPQPAPGGPPAGAPTSSASSARMPTVSMEGLDMPASGELGSPAVAHLYYIAAARELTGLLTLILPDRELTVHFRKGNPELIDSTHPEDSLDTFLLGQRLATQQQIDQAQAQAGKFGGDLLAALFGLGLLNPNAVFQHLGARAAQLLFRVLTAEHGTFAFDLEDFPTARALPLGNKWGVYLEALRKVPAPDVRRRLMGALDLPVMKAGGRVPISEVRLTPQETRAYNHFDGARTLNQLIGAVPGEADVLVRVAWMLAPLELVSYAGVTITSKASAPRPPPPAAPPPKPAPVAAPVVAPPAPAPAPAPAPKPAAAAVPGPPPAVAKAPAPGNPVAMPKQGMAYPGGPQQPPPQRPPPPVMAAAPPKPPPPAAPAPPKLTAAPALAPSEEVKQLQAQLETLKKASYFDVLNVKRDADSNAVKIAYLKAARLYHPDTIPPGAPETLAKVKADLFALIGEANRTLSDAAARAEYIAELDAGGTGDKVDVEKLLKAEELFQKGRVLVQARKYQDAFKFFEDAITCNKDEPEFYAWRGYSRFLAGADRKAMTNDAMKDIKYCIDKNPNVAQAHFFQGFILKFNGDTKGAMAAFKKCVALDPKHIDAARELKNNK